MWGRVILLVLIAVTVQHFVRFALRLNTFQKVFNHAPGPCRQLQNVVYGAEDAYLLPNGLLIISSGWYRAPMGRLLRLDLDSSNAETEEFQIDGNFDISTFSPHGITAWEDPKTGEITLFAVNHHSDGERVEVFHHDGSKTSKTLKHVKTIQGPKFPVLNDIVATGPDSFYGTSSYSLVFAVEFFSMYPGAGVIHYDSGKISVVATGHFMGNGINFSPDRQYLYVAEGVHNLHVYKVQDDKTLQEVQVYNTGTGVDNIHVDSRSGDLWIGCHLNWYLLIVNLLHIRESAYSQVIRLKVDDGRIVDVREVYANDGTDISGSSVAIPYKKKMFIGSVADRALICDLVYSG